MFCFVYLFALKAQGSHRGRVEMGKEKEGEFQRRRWWENNISTSYLRYSLMTFLCSYFPKSLNKHHKFVYESSLQYFSDKQTDTRKHSCCVDKVDKSLHDPCECICLWINTDIKTKITVNRIRKCMRSVGGQWLQQSVWTSPVRVPLRGKSRKSEGNNKTGGWRGVAPCLLGVQS